MFCLALSAASADYNKFDVIVGLRVQPSRHRGNNVSMWGGKTQVGSEKAGNGVRTLGLEKLLHDGCVYFLFRFRAAPMNDG